MKAEVKRAWAEYLYAWNLRAMYAEQRMWADRLQEAGALRYAQGESTLLEKQMAATVAAEMRNKLFQAEEELKLAAKRLQWCCYAPEPIRPRVETIAHDHGAGVPFTGIHSFPQQLWTLSRPLFQQTAFWIDTVTLRAAPTIGRLCHGCSTQEAGEGNA